MKKGKIRHIHVEPTDNGGATVKIHRHAPPMSTKSAMPTDFEANDESLGAQSPEEAGAHVTAALKSHMSAGAEKPGHSALRGALKARKGGYGV